jgi:hypothetical protein
MEEKREKEYYAVIFVMSEKLAVEWFYRVRIFQPRFSSVLGPINLLGNGDNQS